MYNKVLGGLGVGFMIIAVLALFGCSGGNSTPSGAAEDAVLVAQSFDEGCTLCHRSGSFVDIDVVHSEEGGGLQGEITAVTVNDGAVTIEFRLFDSTNNFIPLNVPASNIRFTIAKLVPGAGAVNDWQSYINVTETKGAGVPGSAPDGNTAMQASSERASTAGGTFVNNGDGSYSYTLSFDITAVTSPLPVAFDPTLTHRVAMQVADNVANPFFDFIPNGGVPADQSIATNATCNECHIKLGLHGGDRIQIGYCVTCHNPGTADANSDNTVDFKVMIHKIHAGEALQEVEAGGEYAIWGNQNSKHDYSTVVYPQDLRNCTKCHDSADAATPQGDNWKNAPSAAACTACHPAINPALYPNFPNLTATEIEQAHLIPAQVAAADFQFNLISITNTGPGQFPEVTFSVTNPTTQSAYDILTDPAFTSTAGGASRLGILIGWNTADYTNTGSGSPAGQPIAINPLSIGAGSIPATRNADGSFTVASLEAIPSDVTGSGIVALEGHPAGDFDGDSVFRDRIPVKNAFLNFPITDPIAEPRRAVVDINRCNSCHGVLSLHGNNRTDEIQVCVICHNPNATDIEMRPADPLATPDGKVEEAIDFKSMIHAIHAGDADDHGFRQDGIVIFGFGGSINDFSEVRLPAAERNLANCAGCHVGTTNQVPLDANVLPTTVRTGDDLDNPDDDRNITPVASVCSSCHDLLASRSHMSEEGGLFDFAAFAPAQPSEVSGGEIDSCGPGPITAQPAGHTDRPDCCSCHSFQ